MPIMGYEDWTLNKWENMFQEIYGNQNRGKTPEQIWSRMIEEVSELVYPIENQKIKWIESGIADIFAWLMGFTSKTQIDLQEETWKKFKDGCPSCGSIADCTCMLSSDNSFKPIDIKEKKLERYRDEPKTLNAWQDYLRELYGKANEELPPIVILSRLIEDIGGVAKLIRRKKEITKVGWKLSSVFAWLLALCNRYSTIGEGKFRLSDIVWQKYEYRCPKCYQKPCECIYLTSIFIGYTGDVENEMRNIKEILEKTYNLTVYVFPDLGPDFSEGRMYAVFDAIAKSDAGVILLGNKFSSRVYAEYIELTHKKNRDFVFVYVKEDKNERDPELSEFIKEIRYVHKYTPFEDVNELKRFLERDIKNAKEIAKKLGY